jgi:hypothetical protein
MTAAPQIPSAAWSVPIHRARPRARDASAAPAILLLLVLFLFSGGVLWHLGVNYDGFSGSAAAKVHPATYLAPLCLLWAMVSSGDPVGFCLRTARDAPASLLLLVIGTALLVQIALRSGTGLSGSIDTFVGPALVMMLLVRIAPARLGPLETALHGVMLANACLGLAEFATGRLVFPYRLDGEAFPTDTRSAAFQGHPLVNALVTATYVLALIAGGGQLRPWQRLTMLALQTAALVTFGGRSTSLPSASSPMAAAPTPGSRCWRSSTASPSAIWRSAPIPASSRPCGGCTGSNGASRTRSSAWCSTRACS